MMMNLRVGDIFFGARTTATMLTAFLLGIDALRRTNKKITRGYSTDDGVPVANFEHGCQFARHGVRL